MRSTAIAAALAVLGGVTGCGGADSDDVGTPSVAPTSVTSSPNTAAPAPRPVETVRLPEGISEFVTARAHDEIVEVRSQPPARWDDDLSPVVDPTGPTPPRSAQDLDRPPLPAPEAQIAGRHAVERGWRFSNPGAYRPRQPLVFGVVQRQGPWIEVQLPVRPNGTTGWVHEAQVELSSTTLQVDVLLSERRLRVIRSGAEVFTAPISVGRPSTPTPTGRFHVTDIVPSIDPEGGYGPVALALDGYSEALDQFAGDSAPGSPDDSAPVLAIHGTNRPDSIGRAESNGCPRLFNDDMLTLAELVPAGTPVSIWP